MIAANLHSGQVLVRETAVPAQALGFLAEEGIKFTVIGPAPYEVITPVRDPGPVAV